MGRSTAQPRRSAFTLLELVIILTIAGLVAGVAMPRFNKSLATQRVVAAAGRVRADLSHARWQAKMSSTSLTVAFDPLGESYAVDADAVQLTEEPYVADIVAADFGGDASIVFDGYGVPDSGGSVTVEVNGRQRTISINAESGLATVN